MRPAPGGGAELPAPEPGVPSAQNPEKYPNQTHYVWVDFGYQRYPVYEGAAVNWDAVCQETICLAMVGGVPDTSMIVVPAGRLDAVCQETLALCQAALEAGESLPWEQDLWLQMMQAHPDWFTPGGAAGPPELLGLTMLSREEDFMCSPKRISDSLPPMWKF